MCHSLTTAGRSLTSIADCCVCSSQECLGFHLGAPQTANLGDGNGSKNQIVELRQDFGNDILGSCLESIFGGNHFR